MGKRRGGKRQNKKKTAIEADAEVSVHLNDESTEAPDLQGKPALNAEINAGKEREKGKQPEDVAEYFQRIKEIISNRPFHDELQFEAFVSSTVEEIKNRGLLLLSDRQCSWVCEQLISLLSLFIFKGTFSEEDERNREKISNKDEANANSSNSSRDNYRIQARLQCLNVFLSLIRYAAPAAAELSIHPNGSHVLQTLLEAVPAVLYFQRQQKQKQNKEDEQSIEDFFLFIINRLREEGGGLLHLMQHSAASHVLRSLFRSLAGVCSLSAPSAAGGRRTQRNFRKDSEETLLPFNAAAAAAAGGAATLATGPGASSRGVYGQVQQLLPVPASFSEELKQIAAAAAAAVKEQQMEMPFHIYAAPCLQLLMLVLHATKQTEALQQLLEALLFSSKEGSPGEEIVRIADALIDSPTGSRTLETAAPLLSPSNFQRLFAKWIVKRINTLAASRFGNFFLQKILQASVFEAAHLKMFIEALDFRVCLEACTPAVLWRCAEACLRLHTSFKEFSRKLLEALAIEAGRDICFVWLALLMQCPVTELPIHLKAIAGGSTPEEKETEKKEEKNIAELSSKKRRENEENELNQRDKTKEEEEEEEHKNNNNNTDDNFRLYDICTPSGCSILLSLLKFPSSAVQPINAGFKHFVKFAKQFKIAVKRWKNKKGAPEIEMHSLLELMTTNKLTSRLLQQILNPSTSSIHPNGVNYLIRNLITFISSFALDPVGGFVLTAMYTAATPENKRQIVEALVPLESDLKEKNYTAYMKCEIYRFTKNEEEWKERQNKRHKTRDLFKDILSSAAIEEEEEETKTKTKTNDSLWAADPIAQQLMASEGMNEGKLKDKNNKNKEKKKRKKIKEEEEEDLDKKILQNGDPQDKESEKQINEIFLQALDEKQRSSKPPKKKKRVANESTSDKEYTADAGLAVAAPSEDKNKSFVLSSGSKEAKEDPSLDAALFFIEGTNASLSKREIARRKKEEAAKLRAAESIEGVRKKTEGKKKKLAS